MTETQPGGLAASALARLTRRPRSLVIQSAVERIDGPVLASYLATLGEDEPRAERLDRAVDEAMASIRRLELADLAPDSRLSGPVGPAYPWRSRLRSVSRS